MLARGKGFTFFVLPTMVSVVLLSSLVLPGLASSQASPSPSRNFAGPSLASALDEGCEDTAPVLTIDALSYPSNFTMSTMPSGYVMISEEPGTCLSTSPIIEIITPGDDIFQVSFSASDCISVSEGTQIVGGVTYTDHWCYLSDLDAGDYATVNFYIAYLHKSISGKCPTSATFSLLVSSNTDSYVGDSATMSLTVLCLSTTTTSSTTSSTTSTSTMGTAPCNHIGPNQDECTGTPLPGQYGGTLTAASTIQVNVTITGTTATGSVTIDITDDGGTPPSSGADLSLRGGAAYYDVEVTGASSGTAQVCITTFSGATMMDYYQPPSGPWTQAASVSFTSSSICGEVFVYYLSGTPIAVGVRGTATAPCTSTAPDEDECTGTPVGGNLTAVSTDTGVNVSITGTTATGPVTINATEYGDTPPSSGADLSLGSGAAYYDVEVSGATDGTAEVCITPSNGATTMDYYQSPSGPWTQAAPLSFPGDSICGVIPVSALSGTPIAVGTASTTTTSSSTTTSTTTSSTTTASTSTTGGVPVVPEFPLALGIGVAVALALPALLLAEARLRKP
ncbi:MAG: hypothetical protein ACLP9K_10110 [Nitrososphaerales archaeon]